MSITEIVKNSRYADKPDLLQIATQTEQTLTQIQELWKEIHLPSLQDILSNPAICPSKKNIQIRPDLDGHFHEFIQLADLQDYDIDTDLIQWTVPFKGRITHPLGFFSQVITDEENPDHYCKGIPRHCNKPTCPECAPYHIEKDTPAQALKIVSKSKDLRHTMGWMYGKLQHVTVSVPERYYYKALTNDGFNDLKRQAMKYAQKCGIIGGLIVFHPFRQDGVNDDDLLPEDYTPTPENSLNKHNARFSPHFHIVGFGFVSGSEQLYDSTGWIVRSLRTGQKSITNLAEVTSIIRYLKSHIGFVADESPFKPERRYQSIVWFGACAPKSQTLVGTIRVFTPQLCPECGEQLTRYHVHGRNNDVSRLGRFYSKVEYPIFTKRSNVPFMRSFLRDNCADIEYILGYLDRHPHSGYCAISKRQYTAIMEIDTYQAQDNTLHLVERYATVSINQKRTPSYWMEITPQEHTQPEPYDMDLDLGSCIDYHLPPDVI